MTAADYARLTLLAAIWGGTLICMRVAAPEFGIAWTAEGRLLIAGLVLAVWLRLTGGKVEWRRHWKAYAAIALVNLALPSLLYAFAMRHIPAAMGAMINSTSPIFGALLAALFLGERFTGRMAAGCAAGLAGVALVVQPGGAGNSPLFLEAAGACVLACVLYDYNGVVMRRYAAGVPSRSIAVGGQLAAALMLLPLAAIAPPEGPVSALATGNLLLLALLGNALGFVLYFRLISDIGATRALTVTYLIPAFSLFWAMLFLGESLPASALAGGVLILAGTALVTRG